MNVVLVEDHLILQDLIASTLVENGHRVLAFDSAESFDSQEQIAQTELFLIDLNLPGEDGLSLVERIRSSYPLAYIIIITARTSVKDKIRGYNQGADLYLPKPFEVAELVAAVDAFVARQQRSKAPVKEEYWLDAHKKNLSNNDNRSVELSDSEVIMLLGLIRAKDRQLEYWQLAERLELDLDADNLQSTLEVRMSRLRKKLSTISTDEKFLKSVRGVGYRLCLPIQLISI